MATVRSSAAVETTSAPPVQASRSGTVLEQYSSQPLGGVDVRWTVGDKRRPDSGAELGRATSVADGTFVVELSDDPAAQEAYRALACDPGARAWLTADGAQPAPDEGEPVTLTVAAKKSEAPTRGQWSALAQTLMANRSLDASGLVDALSAGVDGWPVATRAAALAAVHAALAEANGGVATVLDFDALSRGKLVEALHPPKGIGFVINPAGWPIPRLPQSDRTLYRDYLRGIWENAADQMYRQVVHVAAPPASADAQLDARFHQDFHTVDDAQAPAASLLVPILVSILTADGAREGFGLPAAAIPAKGALSDEDYLAQLVTLTKVSPDELRNRFRISVVRGPGARTTPVELNVEALLGLLRDTYQSQIEPFPALPVIEGNGHPLVFGEFLGRAPFFLEYEEWLERQRTFFPENAYDIRQAPPVFNADFKKWAISLPAKKLFSAGWFADVPDREKTAAWLQTLPPIADTIAAALASLDLQNYPDAGGKLDQAEQQLRNAISAYDPSWVHSSFTFTYSTGTVVKQPVSLVQRAKQAVTNLDELTTFEHFFTWTGPSEDFPDPEYLEYWLAAARTKMLFAAAWTKDVFIPYIRSRIKLAGGDYAAALQLLAPLSGYTVGLGQTTDTTPYDGTGPAKLWQQLSLPYTVGVPYDDTGEVVSAPPTFQDESFATIHTVTLAPFEQRFFQLVQGEAMLALADTLYRADTPDQIARARELYKGILFMHGEDPGISPHFGAHGPLLLPPDPFWRYSENPAKVAQVSRARLALFQIEAGLNAYGYADDFAPLLRYTPLKQAADVFAQAAKNAQNDYLTYMTRLEQAQIELWQTQALVKKADASVKIAVEQIAIAQDGVAKAQAQVTAIEQQIAAKEAEIADKNSLFSQFSDYFSGVKDSLEGMVPLAGKVLADEGGAAGGSLSADDLLGIVGKTSSGGASAGEDAAASALGSGAAFLVGYGAFAYTSYQSMSSMADAANKRNADLTTLQNTVLPAAKAQVALRQRDVAIAQQQQTIAQADLEYGQQLLRFQHDRFLSIELWNRLSLFANQLMRGYVDLGAKTAWFAERALAFEQDREIRIVKLDYWPTMLRGITGADSLLFDLAELAANRLQGVRLTAPVKHTVSLAREFPLAFGQLKKTGTCRFATDEATLRALYPGTYGYRLRAVTVAADNPDGAPPRGILRNGGISHVGAADGSSSPLVRFSDALPLSEFRLRDDLFVYGLPGETLLQFEGSGYSTAWELELPPGPNAQGLRTLADVLISFDMNASWSGDALPVPGPAAGAITLAASIVDPRGLKALRDPSKTKATLVVDPRRVQLPRSAVKRTITNMAVVLVGADGVVFGLDVKAQTSGETASVTVTDGLALSNAGVLLGGGAAQPLNALAGAALEQPFALDVDKKTHAKAFARAFDLVCWFEYEPPNG
jgi:receptor-binding and translocation channel-forming TcA subunit of Tc toxin